MKIDNLVDDQAEKKQQEIDGIGKDLFIQLYLLVLLYIVTEILGLPMLESLSQWKSNYFQLYSLFWRYLFYILVEKFFDVRSKHFEET